MGFALYWIVSIAGCHALYVIRLRNSLLGLLLPLFGFSILLWAILLQKRFRLFNPQFQRLTQIITTTICFAYFLV